MTSYRCGKIDALAKSQTKDFINTIVGHKRFYKIGVDGNVEQRF